MDRAARLRGELSRIDGLISVERFQSLTDPDKLLSLSFWRDEEAAAARRNHAEHQKTQAAGRQLAWVIAVRDGRRKRSCPWG